MAGYARSYPDELVDGAWRVGMMKGRMRAGGDGEGGTGIGGTGWAVLSMTVHAAFGRSRGPQAGRCGSLRGSLALGPWPALRSCGTAFGTPAGT